MAAVDTRKYLARALGPASTSRELEQWHKFALQAYLDDLMARLGPLPETSDSLYLPLDVDAETTQKRRQRHDVENYLTPYHRSRPAAHRGYLSGEHNAGAPPPQHLPDDFFTLAVAVDIGR